MGKILHHGNWKKEKGVTLIEVIVSLSVLIVVSIATVSVAVFSTTSTKKNAIKRYFSNKVNDIAYLYLSYEETDFVKAIAFAHDIEIFGYADKTVYFDSNYSILDSDENYKYKLVLDFEESTSLVLSSYNSADSLIYSRSISK